MLNLCSCAVFEQRFQHYEQIVKQRGTIEVLLCKLVVIGPPRVGKTSLIRRFLGDKIPTTSPSTPVAESPQKVIYGIHKIETNKALIGTDDIFRINNLSDEASFWFKHISPIPECVSSCSVNQTVHDKNDTLTCIKDVLKDANEKSSPWFVDDLIQLNIIDTGGQPEFQEILPLIVNGPAIYILVFKANESIKKCYEVVYYNGDGTKTRSYTTNITTEEVLMKSISTIMSFPNNGSKPKHQLLQVKGNSVVALVATHCNSKEGLSEEERALQLRELNEKANEFHNVAGLDANEPIFMLDNTALDEDKFIQFRSFLRRVIKDNAFTVKLPPQWFALYTGLQNEKKSYVEIGHVQALAKSLYIDNDELETALWFLHHCAGVLMYFKDVEDLHDKVFLNIQFIFDCVTELIKDTFVLDNTTHRNDVRTFQNTGMFTMEGFKKIVKNNVHHEGVEENIDLRQIICLLRYLHIIAVTRDGHYFLPCVLRSTELQLPLSDDLLNEPPLLIRFEICINPFGVFSSIIVHLIDTEEWEPLEVQYRNKMVFMVGKDSDRVELIVWPQYYEIRAYPTEVDVRCHGPFRRCNVQQTIKNSIDCVCQNMSHMEKFTSDNVFQWGFYCICCDPIHPVFFRPGKDDMTTRRIACNKKGHPKLSSLSRYQKKWLEVSVRS